ncbi:MAG: SBBP repeat-containing protein, partial [Thermoplasmata archaeon]|nr:SBBP repeat-containing protein [Thermoplasmata archaeon]
MGFKSYAILIIAILAIAPLSLVDMSSALETSITIGGKEVQAAQHAPPEDLARMLSGLNGYFIENRGQVANPEVLYYAHGDPLSLGLTQNGIIFTLFMDASHISGPDPRVQFEPLHSAGCSFKMRFVECDYVEPQGYVARYHRNSFFVGNQPAEWYEGVMSYGEVLYESLYDGIDLRFYFYSGMLKYDFVVEPGADASQIVMEYSGIDGLSIDPFNGELVIQTPLGPLRDASPILLKGNDGDDERVPCDFRLLGPSRVTFDITYDRIGEEGFVIDPGLLYSTYLGSDKNNDNPDDIAIDPEGNVYVIGVTSSADFPETHRILIGDEDIFLVKLDPTLSTILFSTLIGGHEGGFGFEFAMNIEVHEQSLFMVGVADSYDFPTTNDAMNVEQIGERDIFLMKFSLDGSLLHSTFLGGSGFDQAKELHFDKDGSILIGGVTASWDFPTTPGAFCETRSQDRIDWDYYIMRLNSSLDKILACTLIGGSEYESTISIGLGPDGSVIGSGHTSSLDFNTTHGTLAPDFIGGSYDSIVFKLNSDLSQLQASTYLGTTSDDASYAMTVGKDGAVLISLITYGSDFNITVDAFQQDIPDSTDVVI